MRKYVIRRLLLFLPTLIGVSVIVFGIMRIVPGDAALNVLLGPTGQGEGNITREALEAVRVQLGIAREKVRVGRALVRIAPTQASRAAERAVVVPDIVNVKAGEAIQLAAYALDREGFAIPSSRVDWTGKDQAAGIVSSTGVFVAGHVIKQFPAAVQARVVASSGGTGNEVVAYAPVHVVQETSPQKLAEARVFPEKVLLQPGEVIEFAAIGFDETHGLFMAPRFRWQVSDSLAGNIDDRGRLSAGRTPGDFVVTGEVIQTVGIPLHQQYFRWIKGFVTGQAGTSIRSGTPVFRELFGDSFAQFLKRSRFMVTFEVAVLSMLVAVSIGIPFGILMAVRQDTWIDYILRVVSIAGLAMPNFWIGTMVILILVSFFSWLPPLGFQGFLESPSVNLKQLVWPVLAIATTLTAFISRMTRSQMLEVLRQDYMRTAWSKGLAERLIILRHALRNAMLPVVTIIALQIAVLMGGTVIMEVIFNLPGLGRALADSILFRDYPMIQSMVMIFATILLTTNLAVDLLYGWLDPRIRYT